MWNELLTNQYEGMIAETVAYQGYQGDQIYAYLSRPLTPGKHPGIVLIPHMPGWDEFCRETARRLTQHGYMVLCPDIYSRFGHGTPTEVSAMVREAGGVSDKSVMADTQAAINLLASIPNANQKVGVIGMCSGGRHAFLAACQLDGLSAAVDCWGGGVVASVNQLSEAQPIAPIDFTADLSCPLLGIFGNEDMHPTPEQVDLHEAQLQKYHKEYTFYRYDGAGHGFFYYHNKMYRQEQAMDAWEKVFAFFAQHLLEPSIHDDK